MRLQEVDPKVIATYGLINQKHNLNVIFEEFLNSNMKMCEVIMTSKDYKDARTAQRSMHVAARRRGLPIRVFTKCGRVFMTREDNYED